MEKVTVGVSGMSCDHCARTVAGAVTGVPGVVEADVDLAGGEVAVTANGIDVGAVRDAIVEAGYEPAG